MKPFPPKVSFGRGICHRNWNEHTAGGYGVCRAEPGWQRWLPGAVWTSEDAALLWFQPSSACLPAATRLRRLSLELLLPWKGTILLCPPTPVDRNPWKPSRNEPILPSIISARHFITQTKKVTDTDLAKQCKIWFKIKSISIGSKELGVCKQGRQADDTPSPGSRWQHLHPTLKGAHFPLHPPHSQTMGQVGPLTLLHSAFGSWLFLNEERHIN